MSTEKIPLIDGMGAQVVRGAKAEESSPIKGTYSVVCHDMYGREKWSEVINNVVTYVGKNLFLDTMLSTSLSPYNVTGPYMGLIGASGFASVSINDTMTSHPGWNENGGTLAPVYGGSRKTCVWTTASGGTIALSSALVFSITSTGTVTGAFVLLGTGASATIDNTSGVLLSAGQFVGGNKVVSSGDTLNCNYTLSM